jgi:hypothetical protein
VADRVARITWPQLQELDTRVEDKEELLGEEVEPPRVPDHHRLWGEEDLAKKWTEPKLDPFANVVSHLSPERWSRRARTKGVCFTLAPSHGKRSAIISVGQTKPQRVLLEAFSNPVDQDGEEEEEGRVVEGGVVVGEDLQIA